MPQSALIETVDNFCGNSAVAALAARPRKGDVGHLCTEWRSIRAHLPDAKRVKDVDDSVEWCEYAGAEGGRTLFEAVAKFAIWFEGYADGMNA